MDYQAETLRTYDLYPADFDRKFTEHFKNHCLTEADEFISLLPGKSILDVGAGPGNHAVYFRSKGLDVLCMDRSPEMLKLCAAKKLRNVCMDIENINKIREKFDGLWMYASLLHLPKAIVPALIPKFADRLQRNGILALAVKEGNGEGFEEHPSYPETKRWFSYYSDKEVVDLFSSRFDLISQGKTISRGKRGEYTFLKHFFRVK